MRFHDDIDPRITYEWRPQPRTWAAYWESDPRPIVAGLGPDETADLIASAHRWRDRWIYASPRLWRTKGGRG